jgi:hypothetical protein
MPEGCNFPADDRLREKLSHAGEHATLKVDSDPKPENDTFDKADICENMMLFPISVFALSLFFGPEDDEYAAAVAAVADAMVEINTDPEQGSARLRAALERLWDFAPMLAEDPAALEQRTLAEFALARAELARGDRYAAAATIDASLEALGGRPVDTERLGPSLGALVEERAQALQARGSARLRIECDVPCRVLVDERNAGDVEVPGSARELAVPLGRHRVWVEDLSRSEGEPLRTTVALDSADALATVTYPEAEVPPASRVRSSDDDFRMPGPIKRVAPRWLEVSALAVGGAAVVAGAVLWAIDSRCPRGADPNDVVACPELYDTRVAGITLVAAGGAAALTGGVMLVVDETRLGDHRGREVALVWTARF